MLTTEIERILVELRKKDDEIKILQNNLEDEINDPRKERAVFININI